MIDEDRRSHVSKTYIAWEAWETYALGTRTASAHAGGLSEGSQRDSIEYQHVFGVQQQSGTSVDTFRRWEGWQIIDGRH